MQDILVAGAGIFGVTAALELRRRGHRVRLLDPGPLPHPLAASTDVSKVVRLEYGADEEYTALAERAIDGWRRWNRDLLPLFHEIGVIFLRRPPMLPGTFEQDSYDVVSRRGHPIELLDEREIRKRFPAWGPGWTSGTFNPTGGFVESGQVVSRLLDLARQQGVDVIEGNLTLDAKADQIVCALGAWTPHVLPHLANELRSTGHPVFHLKPRDPRPFAAGELPVFCADISSTGWYGFPVHPSTGLVKIARHGPGREMHPESPQRAVTTKEIAEMRAFVAETFPSLAGAELASTRVCLYCDSPDGHFWIARDPDRKDLVVAAGDSGHGFKFAPILGELIADVVEGRNNPAKFRWRAGVSRGPWQEAARAVQEH
ncbi:MAG: FAD-dependent oxidoreductase [Myxococcales bacterium]|nr:FAD-dependent oxidoreductase [Myxococcales bacterium]